MVGLHLLLTVLATLPGAAALAQPAAPESSVTGTFTMVMGDPRDPSGDHRSVSTVADDQGRQHTLRVSDVVAEAAGGLTGLVGKRVTVTGTSVATPEPGSRPVLAASSIEAAATPEASVQALAGPQRFVTILCRFSDSTTVTPKTVAYMEGLLGDTYPGISDFWRENSYGLINNTGSVVAGWFNLPQPRSSYLPGGNLDHDKAARDCTALADTTVNFNDYLGINLVFNQTLDCCAWGGSWALNLDGTYKAWPMTWMPPWGVTDQAVLGHEMGHAYGLPHSSGNYGAVYDSRWDVMSLGGRALDTPDPTYGRLGTHTIGYHKDFLGWIPPARKYTAGVNSCQVLTIDMLSQVPATTGTYLMAQIPTTANRFFTVEARGGGGYDGGGRLPGEAIVIHDVLTTRTEPAHVVDSTLNNDPNDAGAMWVPGETFTDATSGVSVAVLSASTAGWSVRVTRGTGVCVDQVPGTFTSVTPARVLDTRSGAESGGAPPIGACNPSPCARVGAGIPVEVQVTGRAGVPATGVSAVVMNVAVTGPSADGFLRVWPSGTAEPNASNLNYLAGQTVANLVTVKLGATGTVALSHSSSGTTNVVADVAGFYGEAGGASGARFFPLTPARVLDTRSWAGPGGNLPMGACLPAPCGPVVAGSPAEVQITGQGEVPASGVSAVVMSVAVTEPTTGGFLRVWPSDISEPNASNLNYAAFDTRPNLVVAKLSTGTVRISHNVTGSTHVIADVAGWFNDGSS